MLKNSVTETEFFLENSVSLRALYFLYEPESLFEKIISGL